MSEVFENSNDEFLIGCYEKKRQNLKDKKLRDKTHKGLKGM